MKAIWKETVIAESDETIVFDGNHYFPEDALISEYFERSSTTSVCPWKGSANYYSIVVGDGMNPDAAWYYVKPKAAATEIAGYFAFWKGVQIVE